MSIQSALADLNARFKYRSDRGESWKILKGKASIFGDCEDYSLTLIWLAEGKSLLRFWLALLTFKYVMFYCKTPRGVGHAILWVRGHGWVDNIQREFVPSLRQKGYRLRFPYLVPHMLLLMLLRPVLRFLPVSSAGAGKKIAIVVGHNARAQGAVRSIDGMTEFKWNGHLAELIRAHDPRNIKIFNRVPGGGYSREIDRVYGEVDAWGADCSIELHFNGSVNPRSTGCLTLTSGTRGSRSLARRVHDRVLTVMGNEDDGIRARGRRDRGGRSLWQGRAPAIMTEPYFGSNADFCQVADAHKDELAEAIYRGAVEYLEAA